MFNINQTIRVNDPANVFCHGHEATIVDVATFGSVTVYTVRDSRGWRFALRADKVEALA